MPVHGEYKHLKAQAKIAESLGISKDNIFILSSGDVLEVSEEKAKVSGRVPVGAILVDGLGVGDVGNVVLRDRQHLAEDGIMIVVMSLDRASGELVAGPDIVSRGFVYVKESDELIEEARRTVDDALQAKAPLSPAPPAPQDTSITVSKSPNNTAVIFLFILQNSFSF